VSERAEPIRTARPAGSSAPKPQLILACGALAREILAVLDLNGFTHIELRCLSALLHNRPERIAPALRSAIAEAQEEFSEIFVAYADCGTGGEIDRVLREADIRRLPGAHCYEFYSGIAEFAARQEADLGAFYLTDFLARHFQTLVIEGLGLDRHPQLRDAYFGNYAKVVHLAQSEDPALREAAEAAAKRLDLAFEHRFVGYGRLADDIREFGRPKPVAP
jgi:hypothetical protein